MDRLAGVARRAADAVRRLVPGHGRPMDGVLVVEGRGTSPTPDSADLHDLEAIAAREGLTRAEAFHRYAWNPDFGPLARTLAREHPDTFSSAAMNPDGWVGGEFRFTARPPRSTLDLIATLPVASRVITDEPYTRRDIVAIRRATRRAVRRRLGTGTPWSIAYRPETRTVEVLPHSPVRLDRVAAASAVRADLASRLDGLPAPAVRILPPAPPA